MSIYIETCPLRHGRAMNEDGTVNLTLVRRQCGLWLSDYIRAISAYTLMAAARSSR